MGGLGLGFGHGVKVTGEDYRGLLDQQSALIRIQSRTIQGYEDGLAKLARKMGYRPAIKATNKPTPTNRMT